MPSPCAALMHGPFPVAGGLLDLGDTGTASIGTFVGSPGPGASWRLMVTATDSTAEPPAAEAFYDARRDVHYTKPALRGWLHLLWFGVSLVVSTLLLARAHGATRITASAIYAASVSGMFGASALYHRGSWSAAWRQRLQRLDHAMIFFLIAGTATPAFLLAVRGILGAGLPDRDVGTDGHGGPGPDGPDV